MLAGGGLLQAVDGVAVKMMVDRWWQAAPAAEPIVLEAAIAVRQVKTGRANLIGIFARSRFGIRHRTL